MGRNGWTQRYHRAFRSSRRRGIREPHCDFLATARVEDGEGHGGETSCGEVASLPLTQGNNRDLPHIARLAANLRRNATLARRRGVLLQLRRELLADLMAGS
jgi:hypothetical protein